VKKEKGGIQNIGMPKNGDKKNTQKKDVQQRK